MATAATPPAPAPAPEETIVGIAATAAVHLCGELTPEAAETAATSGAYKSWLYLNPQCSADECGVGSAAAAAGLEFACLEVNKDAVKSLPLFFFGTSHRQTGVACLGNDGSILTDCLCHIKHS